MKTAIIGGGIVGLYLAWKLAKKSEEVVVFEKKAEIGNRVCSGLFSERILSFVPQSEKLITNRINSAIINFPKKKIKLKFSKDFYVMSHFELDKMVADLAQKAGAKIMLSQSISKLPKGFDRIIGCDGANSIVRQNLKMPEPNYRLAIQGFIEKTSNENFVETWACDDGFIWRIPRGNDIEFGILSDVKKAKQIFENFLNKNNLKIDKIGAKIVAQGFLIPKDKRMTLCGESAGLTKPWSGGGVIWGLTAASFILEKFPDFLAYQKRAKSFFLPKLLISKIALKKIYFLGFNIPWLLPKNVKIEADFLF